LNVFMLTVAAHPLLDLVAFVSDFPRPLAEMPRTLDVEVLLSLAAPAPMQSSDIIREAVRRLLRHGGFKPTGRSKPASEYLLKAVREGHLAAINLAVDICNAISLHSGVPITVVDLDLVKEPLSVGVAPPDSAYVFNASGQTIDLAGLICLFDLQGPCGSPVKDAQRTKTGPQTQRTLSLIWGTNELPGRATEAGGWYRKLLEEKGARTQSVGS
jgi:DNA/RNA-binding domain of Phe-tRNA-synthetase-like protein